MPSYPIEPDKLLDAADLLAPERASRGRPRYTAHRRAVSTAYYAVFHAICTRVAEAVFADADKGFQRGVQRWIAHGDIRTVALWISQLDGMAPGSPPPHIASLLASDNAGTGIGADTRLIADGFLELNDMREEADYDHDAVFTRADARDSIALARQVVATVEAAQSAESQRFFGLIAMKANIRSRQ